MNESAVESGQVRRSRWRSALIVGVVVVMAGVGGAMLGVDADAASRGVSPEVPKTVASAEEPVSFGVGIGTDTLTLVGDSGQVVGTVAYPMDPDCEETRMLPILVDGVVRGEVEVCWGA